MIVRPELVLSNVNVIPTDILIKHKVSEDGISLISDMMKSNPTDRMTVTMALLHSWVTIREATPILEDLDSFNDSVQNELDGTSTYEGPATERRK